LGSIVNFVAKEIKRKKWQISFRCSVNFGSLIGFIKIRSNNKNYSLGGISGKPTLINISLPEIP
jgi:hypothetical protein